MAERTGFEPAEAFTSHAFQACTLDRSDTFPLQRHYINLKFKYQAFFFKLLNLFRFSKIDNNLSMETMSDEQKRIDKLLCDGMSLAKALKIVSKESGKSILSLRNCYYQSTQHEHSKVVVMPQKNDVSQEDINLLFGGLLSLLKKQIFAQAKSHYEKTLQLACENQLQLKKQNSDLKKENAQLKKMLSEINHQ